jgi:hypothetical protein
VFSGVSVASNASNIFQHSATKTKLTPAPRSPQVQLYGMGPFPNASRHGGAPKTGTACHLEEGKSRGPTHGTLLQLSSILNLKTPQSCLAADFQSFESDDQGPCKRLKPAISMRLWVRFVSVNMPKKMYFN